MRQRHVLAKPLRDGGEILLEPFEAADEIHADLAGDGIAQELDLRPQMNRAPNAASRQRLENEGFEILDAGQMLFGPAPVEVVHASRRQEPVRRVEPVPGVPHEGELEVALKLRRVEHQLIARDRRVAAGAIAVEADRDAHAPRLRDVDEDRARAIEAVVGRALLARRDAPCLIPPEVAGSDHPEQEPAGIVEPALENSTIRPTFGHGRPTTLKHRHRTQASCSRRLCGSPIQPFPSAPETTRIAAYAQDLPQSRNDCARSPPVKGLAQATAFGR